MKTICWIIIVTVVLVIVIGAVVAFGGYYDVSAVHKEGKLRAWFFSTVMDQSVKHHARGIEMPKLGDSAQVAEGFVHFHDMCVGCHGAPGVSKSEGAEGLNPEPPDLAKSTTDLSDAELFWIVKNGIRMTGMPGFGRTHSDEKIQAIVAFVRQLPTMTPEQYQHFVGSYGKMQMPEEESKESAQ